jgi:hypothetical protein
MGRSETRGTLRKRLHVMGIGPVLRPSMLLAFVDGAGLLQYGRRPPVHCPEIRASLSCQHHSPRSGESADPDIGSLLSEATRRIADALGRRHAIRSNRPAKRLRYGFTETHGHEEFSSLDGNQMLRLRWHGIPSGRAAKATRPQDLSCALPEVFRQGSDNAGLDDCAGSFRGRRGWTGL